MTTGVELNLDGLVGPTHHYGGLGLGNLASADHAHEVSNPRSAALQGLAKMRHLLALGIPQGVLPPHERPWLPGLRSLGFAGSDAAVLAEAGRAAPGLLSAMSSASAMWTANAATVSPSADTADGRLHLTPANLVGQVHRSIEAPFTTRVLRTVFDGPRFVVHDPLPSSADLGDEGAANHGRVTGAHAGPGVELFVYGVGGGRGPTRYRARQTATASEAVARRHGLAPSRVVVARQDPAAIDAGVFHNDVISVVDRDLMLVHESAFADPMVPDRLVSAAQEIGVDLRVVVVPSSMLSVDEAVSTYLFNSQLVTAPDGRRLLIAPIEVVESRAAGEALALFEAAGVHEVVTLDLRQSMHNGGGPACLRLRVALTEAELADTHPGVLLDADLVGRLEEWVNRHYRDELTPTDLADPDLLEESRRALDALSALLGLGSIYEFQRQP